MIKKINLPHISQLVTAIFGGLILGVGVKLWDIINLDYLLFLSGVISFVVLLFFYRNQNSWIFVLLICGVLIGFLHVSSALDYVDNSKNNTKISDEFTLVSQPVRSGRFLKIFGFSKGHEKVLLTFSKHSNLEQGDKVSVECTLKSPEKFNNFDYPKYLLMQKANYICGVSSYKKVGRENSFLNKIAFTRRILESNISKMMPAPESGLANGLIFGGSNELSADLQNSFALTGMTHIVAVSGYNVSVIVFIVIECGIFLGLWRKQAVFFSIVAVLIFVAMIGFPASGIRAAVMGIIVLFATVFGRRAHSFNLVILACAGMLLWSPLQLRYDIGFQLSFLAVIGILTLYPFFEKIIIKKHKIFGLSEILFLTVSAQIFVLPIILINFHILSLSSLITNLLVLPILPLTMLFVFVASVFSLITFSLAYPFIWLAYFLLFWEISVIEFFAHQNWNTIYINNFSNTLVIFYYIALFGIMYYLKKRIKALNL